MIAASSRDLPGTTTDYSPLLLGLLLITHVCRRLANATDGRATIRIQAMEGGRGLELPRPIFSLGPIQEFI